MRLNEYAQTRKTVSQGVDSSKRSNTGYKVRAREVRFAVDKGVETSMSDKICVLLVGDALDQNFARVVVFFSSIDANI